MTTFNYPIDVIVIAILMLVTSTFLIGLLVGYYFGYQRRIKTEKAIRESYNLFDD